MKLKSLKTAARNSALHSSNHATIAASVAWR